MDSHRGVAQPWDRRPHEPGRRHCHHRRVASRYEGKHVKHRQQTEGVLGGRQIHSRPPAPRRRLPHRPPTQTRSHEAKSIHTQSFRVTVNGRLKSTPGARPAGAVGDGVLYDVTVRALQSSDLCVPSKNSGVGRLPPRFENTAQAPRTRARESERKRTARVSSLPLPRRSSPCHKSAGLARAPQHAARLSLTTCRPAPGSSRC